MLDIRKKDKDSLGAAALLADEFFLYPSLETYRALQKGAERANVWPVVREVVLFFLETGKPPLRVYGFVEGSGPEPKEHTPGGRTIPPWPLPESGVMQTEKPRKSEFPDVQTLIDIAIAEKRVDDVLHWYDSRRQKGTVWFDFNSTDDRVAEAVLQQYPDRSISIWKTVAEGAIALTQPKMYEVAAGYLRKIRRALQNTRRGLRITRRRLQILFYQNKI